MSTSRVIKLMITSVMPRMITALAAAGGNCKRVETRRDDFAGGGDLLTAHHAHGDEIAHHDGDDEDRADDDAGLRTAE